MNAKIPVAAPDLSGNEERYAVEAIRSSWISSTGPFLNRFEAEFASLCDVPHAIAVSNGTVALHLALLGMKLHPGDEVLVPSLTYIATANAVRYAGAEPVFVDVDPQTWCLDPARLEQAITRRTRGIIAVHLMGHPADMDRINEVAAVHGLWVVEDAAEATLARYKGRTAGGLGHVGTFSFFGNKLFTSGEGGALTLADGMLNARLRILRGQGMDPHRRYYFPVTGYNYRLTNVACAILCAQLERRQQILDRRHAIFATYRRLLGRVPGVDFQPVAPWAELSPWMFSVRIDEKEFGLGRDELMACLAQEGIETRPMFIPLHTLPPFREESQRRGEYLPVTDHVSASAVMLPTYTQLSDADLKRIADAIAAAHAGAKHARRAA
jgi:perosamine synthetase